MGVRDALIVGLPHPRLGQIVTTLVQLHPGTAPAAERAHANAHLTGDKVPTAAIDVPPIPHQRRET